ncbi:MAG: acetoin utilization protein [Planctomycetota bacterium]|nr:MAG: acetoin utilization protein [Planctomycetota bacterium]
MSTGFASPAACAAHRVAWGHPERPERLQAIAAALEAAGLAARLQPLAPVAVEPALLAEVHEPAYLALAQAEIAAGRRELSTGDTPLSAGSWQAVLAASGAVLAAVDAVCEGRLHNAFCAVRPPGHHAEPARGMGFCIVNHVALAARHAQRRHGLERVLIADWDLHHGNGTQEAFYADGSVFYFSTHEYGNYPMALTGRGYAYEVGEGPGRGANMNRPLPSGAGDAEIQAAFAELADAMERFRPQLVLISAGFDARHGDPLGGLRVTDEGFAELTRMVLEIARAHAGGRLVSVLEGGYDLEGLGLAAAAHVRELLEA